MAGRLAPPTVAQAETRATRTIGIMRRVSILHVVLAVWGAAHVTAMADPGGAPGVAGDAASAAWAMDTLGVPGVAVFVAYKIGTAADSVASAIRHAADQARASVSALVDESNSTRADVRRYLDAGITIKHDHGADLVVRLTQPGDDV